MIKQNRDPRFDQKWTWPQKTWFQERLALVRAKQREMNRKLTAAPKEAGPGEEESKGNDQDAEGQGYNSP
jgi:hypothetical protein